MKKAGHVEGKCGFSRRNWAVPIPSYESHEQLATYFAQQAKQDRGRKHYAKDKSIAELWEAEQASLLALPEVPYEAFHLSSSIVNKYGEIRIDGDSIPLAGKVSAGSEVLIQAYWDRLVVLNIAYEPIQKYQEPTLDEPQRFLGNRSFRTLYGSLVASLIPSLYRCYPKR